jgi:hypothetical protein
MRRLIEEHTRAALGNPVAGGVKGEDQVSAKQAAKQIKQEVSA